MSFGAVAVAAGIIALDPAFTTGAALGFVLVAIGLAISFFAAEQWGLLGTATTIIGALLLAGGVIGLVGPISPGSSSRRSCSWRSQSRSVVVS